MTALAFTDKDDLVAAFLDGMASEDLRESSAEVSGALAEVLGQNYDVKENIFERRGFVFTTDPATGVMVNGTCGMNVAEGRMIFGVAFSAGTKEEFAAALNVVTEAIKAMDAKSVEDDWANVVP